MVFQLYHGANLVEIDYCRLSCHYCGGLWAVGYGEVVTSVINGGLLQAVFRTGQDREDFVSLRPVSVCLFVLLGSFLLAS